VAIVELLLSLDLDVTATDKYGRTCLHMAATLSEAAPIISLLLGRGADIDAIDIYRSTPLQDAVVYESENATQSLLERGANHAIVSMDGPIIAEALSRRVKEAVVSVLFSKANIFPSQLDCFGMSALDVLAQRGPSVAADLGCSQSLSSHSATAPDIQSMHVRKSLIERIGLMITGDDEIRQRLSYPFGGQNSREM